MQFLPGLYLDGIDCLPAVIYKAMSIVVQPLYLWDNGTNPTGHGPERFCPGEVFKASRGGVAL